MVGNRARALVGHRLAFTKRHRRVSLRMSTVLTHAPVGMLERTRRRGGSRPPSPSLRGAHEVPANSISDVNLMSTRRQIKPNLHPPGWPYLGGWALTSLGLARWPGPSSNRDRLARVVFVVCRASSSWFDASWSVWPLGPILRRRHVLVTLARQGASVSQGAPTTREVCGEGPGVVPAFSVEAAPFGAERLLARISLLGCLGGACRRVEPFLRAAARFLDSALGPAGGRRSPFHPTEP
jgi:hypothetical protein